MTTQSASIETFTPQEAANIIEHHNGMNRPLRESKARQIADAIKRGDWKLNGETIIFGKSGNLLTGQHRLRASVISGLPITTWVVRGVDDSYFFTVDQGNKKTPADILAISGERNAAILAASARWITAVETGVSTVSTSSMSPAETERVVAKHPALRRWSAITGNSNKSRRMFPSPLVAVLTVASEKYGDAVVERFYRHVLDGTGLEKGSPALLLRDRILDQSVHKKVATRVMVAMAIKAVSAFCSGKSKMPFLRWRPEDAWPSM